MGLLLFVVVIAVLFVLALFEAGIAVWAGAVLALGVLTAIAGANLIVALVPGLVLAALAVPQLRKAVLTAPVYGVVKRMLPKVSRTEQEALDAGTVGWDADLFSGRPNWDNLLKVRKPTLSAEEQAFLDGPTEQLCRMLDDWDVRHNRVDLPQDVWNFIKDNGFFGMLISKEHGGLGFSAQAQSQIVSKIASSSVSAGITVMVPNSLGPGELLEKYGTDEQKAKYLERLATGKEVPCFALTGPHAGSDAAGMRDVGVVTRGTYKGKETLGVRLSWDKRYITLAPVATLVGLSFHLHDPDNLLGKGKEVGITLALVPHDHPGVEIGNRHFPTDSAFMNGPIRGRDVFIPLEFLIGGTDYAGQGWRMLMECLSTGRAISLPAIGTVSMKFLLRVTSAYARIRRQFHIPVGVMEGVAEPLARIAKSAYQFEASRALTASMVDEGEKPSVISALLKYRTTEEMRDRYNDAMDIHGGRAVQDGPSNYLFAGYQTVPVAITVEGANILTRTLITFAQGALRAHPFLYKEVAAAQSGDQKAGLEAFDAAFGGHVKFMLANISGSLFQALTFGRFAPAPVDHELARWYRQLYRYAQSFALVADWTVAFLGGDLKRKQRISGRMADVLSDLYLLSAALKRFEDDGRPKEDIAVVSALAKDRVWSIEQSLLGVFANFPNPVLRWLMRLLVFPLGAHARGSSDRENNRLARAAMVPGAQRDRFTTGIYAPTDPTDRVGMLEDALLKVIAAEEAETKLIRAVRKGQVERRLDRDAISDALSLGVLSAQEAELVRVAEEVTDRVIQVDDFAPGVLGRPQGAFIEVKDADGPLLRAKLAAEREGDAQDKGATAPKDAAARSKPAAKPGAKKTRKTSA